MAAVRKNIITTSDLKHCMNCARHCDIDRMYEFAMNVLKYQDTVCALYEPKNHHMHYRIR